MDIRGFCSRIYHVCLCLPIVGKATEHHKMKIRLFPSLVILAFIACGGFTQPALGDYTQEARLNVTGGVGDDQFGTDVIIDGDTLVVTAPEQRAGGKTGTVFIYARGGESWTLQATLNGPTHRPFARSIALENDTLVVGALEDRVSFGGIDAAMAYVYEREGGDWNLAAELRSSDEHAPNRFAASVAMEGDLILVGTPEDNTVASLAGAAYVFRKMGGVWVEEQKLAPAGLAPGASFGQAVEISDGQLLVGAPLDKVNGEPLKGIVYTFNSTPSGWVQDQTLTGPEPGDVFGRVLSADGDTLVVGRTSDHAAGQSSGAAYVFRRVNGQWQYEQQLLGSDITAFSTFGSAVDVNGDTIIVGAPNVSSGGVQSSGASYVFVHNGTAWEEIQKLTASDLTTFSGFGFAVSTDGTGIAVGARYHEGGDGVTYVFRDEGDTEAPHIHGISATPGALVPSNNKMVPVTLTVNATDNAGATTCQIVSVTSDATVDRNAKRGVDYEITGDLALNLRAERNARGRTRTYTVTVECSDASGNTVTESVTISVPGNKSGK